MLDELKSRYPADRYPACARALALGCDITLLRANLRLSPAERLRGALSQVALHDALQSANLTESQRERFERRRVAQKLAAYGFDLERDDSL